MDRGTFRAILHIKYRPRANAMFTIFGDFRHFFLQKLFAILKNLCYDLFLINFVALFYSKSHFFAKILFKS
jgi:hypothetical protein